MSLDRICQMYEKESEAYMTGPIPWEWLEGKTILVAGANGVIGAAVVRLLLHRNHFHGGNMRLLAVSRSREHFLQCFAGQYEEAELSYYAMDISENVQIPERGVQNFQFRYNQAHPNARIWRHMLYKRTFFFFRDGIAFSVQVTLVRFVYAGTSRTFTFYGDLFCAFSHFSSEFIRQAVAEKDIGDSFPALTVPEVVLNVWGSLPPSGFRPRTNPPDITA